MSNVGPFSIVIASNGELHHVQADSSRPASRADTSIAIARPPPALSPATTDRFRAKPGENKKPKPGRGIARRSGDGIRGRKPIAERKCASLRLASSLSNHVPVTVE